MRDWYHALMAGAKYNGRALELRRILGLDKSMMGETDMTLSKKTKGLVFVLVFALGVFVAIVAMQNNAPVTAESKFNDGLVKMQAGEWRGAVSDFSYAIRLRPDFAEAYYQRALASRKQGNFIEAAVDLEEALSLAKNQDNVMLAAKILKASISTLFGR